jgi:hypothetical protein
MKMMKSLIYGATIVLALSMIICQTASGTNSTNTPPPSNGPPSGPPPSSGAPFSSLNLPPFENPRLTDALSAINDPYLNSLKNILIYLPPMEQDVIAQCFIANTDTTRVVDPDCFKSNFTDVKSQSAQGIGNQLTNSSKTTRNSLSCITKISQTYANSTDSAATTINTGMSNIVSQQTTLNNCAAAFVKSIVEILNTRRRFFLTTKENIDASLVKDSQGNVIGLIFSTTEQSTIVKSFKTYADCLNTFVSSFSTTVMSAQALVGQLGQCKSAPAPSSTTAPPSVMPLNSTTPTSNAATDTTVASGSQPPPSGSQGAPSGNPPPQDSGFNNSNGVSFDASGKPIFAPPATFVQDATNVYNNIVAKNSPAWSTLGSKIQQNVITVGDNTNSQDTLRNMGSLHMVIIHQLQSSGTIKKEFDKGVRQEACSSDYLYYCTSGQCSCTGSGCPSEISDTTSISLVAAPTVSTSTSTSIAANRHSGRLLQTPSASGTAGSTPPPSGATGSTPPPSGAAGSNTPPSSGTAGSTSPPSGTSGSTSPPSGTSGSATPPSGTNGSTPPPSGISGSTPPPSGTDSSSNTPSGSTPPPSGNASGSRPNEMPQVNFKNPTDTLTSYYIAEACISGKRIIYSEATFQMAGNVFDYMDKSPQQGNLGQAMAKQFNDCAAKFKAGTADQKKNCRGPMNDQCANSLDGTCRNTGLYNILASNPQAASPYPDACNSSLTSYSEQGCFNWIVQNLLKATIAFDYRNFSQLPNLINGSISTSGSTAVASRLLRYLQTVASSDPTSTDSKAQISGSISDSDMTVDSATATTVPNPNTYVASLNSVTTTTSLSSSFIKTSLNLIAIIIMGLFF